MSAVFLLLSSLLLSQTTATSEADLKRILFPYSNHQAAAYKFCLDADGKQKLELSEQPLLTWTNAAEGYLGAVYVWTYGGRPEVVGCIGSRQTAEGECRVFNELQSLSTA